MTNPPKGTLIPIFVLFVFFFFPYPEFSCDAKTMIEGRVFTEAGPLQGATVHAYTSYDAVISDRASDISAATSNEGQYKLQLPAGDYYMTAKGSKDGIRYFAYLGANPVHVGKENIWIAFMANEVKKPSYSTCSTGGPEVKGVVTYKGKPVKEASIAFYTLDTRKFKGIGYRTESVREDGAFQFSLPPNKYVIIARKTKGNEIGPLENGDLYCYYPSNPLEVKADQTVSIKIPCYPKANRTAFAASPAIKANDYPTVEKLADTRTFGIKGKVASSNGKAVKGIYVLAYPVDPANSEALSKTFTGIHEIENVARTDQNGNYFIPLDKDGNYAVIARSLLGSGTPKVDEVYGVYKHTFRKGVLFKKGQTIPNIDITVVTPLTQSAPETE